MGDENVTEMKEVRFYNILGFWDWEWEREGEKQNTREILVLWLFEGFFSFEFSDVERLAGKIKGIFGIEIHIRWKCMILQIFSNYIINFEICKIGFSKQYYYHIGPWKHNFPLLNYSPLIFLVLSSLPINGNQTRVWRPDPSPLSAWIESLEPPKCHCQFHV